MIFSGAAFSNLALSGLILFSLPILVPRFPLLSARLWSILVLHFQSAQRNKYEMSLLFSSICELIKLTIIRITH